MDKKKRLLWCLLLVLPLCGLHGQEVTTDLLEQGMDLLHKQHNACAAYPILIKFVDDLPEQDRHTNRHALAIEQIHICRIHVSKQLEDWFELAMKYQRKGDRAHADSLFIVYFQNSVTPESRKTRDYADAGTGNANINMKYSKQRAENVAKALTNAGIDAARITVDAKGDTVQPFSENDKNRVTIAIAK